MPEYELLWSGDFDGYSKFKAKIESMMADGWVLVGGALACRDSNDDVEFWQTLTRDMRPVQD